jgi:citronellol/citronellal dehydrogenase
MFSLKDKVIIITGASRGIGREIALRCAKDGARVVIAAKTSDPNPKLPGTIHSVAAEVEAAGGRSLALQVDVRSEESVLALVNKTAQVFGGIDILVNNAGAISLTSTDSTPLKRFDLMQQVNTRATFLCSQAVLPYLRKSTHPHILNLSPPINLKPHWLAPYVAYTISKYGMTLCTLGMAAEFQKEQISVNSLWPKRIIATAAVKMLMGDAGIQHSRTPEIMAEAAYAILTKPKGALSGKCLLDEEVLAEKGIHDFSRYAVQAGVTAQTDLYVD